jgi:hypothetical protein
MIMHYCVGRDVEGTTRKAHRVLVRKHEGKRPLGRPTRRWEHNIEIGLREIG